MISTFYNFMNTCAPDGSDIYSHVTLISYGTRFEHEADGVTFIPFQNFQNDYP